MDFFYEVLKRAGLSCVSKNLVFLRTYTIFSPYQLRELSKLIRIWDDVCMEDGFMQVWRILVRMEILFTVGKVTRYLSFQQVNMLAISLIPFYASKWALLE